MITLHTFQCHDLDAILRHYLRTRHVAAIYCTGAGKTALSLVVAAKTMGEAWVEGNPRFTHTIYVAPTRVIRDGFVATQVNERGHVYMTPEVRSEDDPRVNGLETYLAAPVRSYAIRMTHQKASDFVEYLRRQITADPVFASSKLLVIDEAHHSGEGRRLAELRDLWLSAGGFVLSLTATPDRSDAMVAIAEDVPRVVRSMTRQMAERLAPETLRSDIISIQGEAVTTAEEMHAPDLSNPIVTDDLAARLVEDWVEQERPKLIVRLKNSGDVVEHRTAIVAMAQALHRVGARVFVASDRHQDAQEVRELNARILAAVRARTGREVTDLSEVLAYENEVKTYLDSCVDVIIGMQSVLEGMNWKICSHMGFVGVPRHLLPLIQGIGRAMRDRTTIAGYPERWQNTSRVVLFASVDDEERGVQAHTFQMLSVACYLATFTQWNLVGSLRQVFGRMRFATPDEEERVRRSVEALDLPEPRAALIREALARAEALFYERVTVNGRKPSNAQTVEMTMRYIAARMQGRAGDVTHSEVMQVLLAQNRAARDATVEETQRLVDSGEELPAAVEAAIRHVSARFAQEARESSEADTVVQRVMQSLRFNASMMETYAEQMQAAMRPTDPRPAGPRNPTEFAIQELLT